jgi:hypothetical protein
LGRRILPDIELSASDPKRTLSECSVRQPLSILSTGNSQGPEEAHLVDLIPHPIQFVLALGVLLLSSFAALMGGSRLKSVYFDESDFVVLSSYEKCSEPYNNRCVRHYIVQQQTTGAKADLVPFGGQFPVSPLPDDIHIRKKQGFIYEVEGDQVEWPDLALNYWLLIGGLLVFGLWFYLGGMPLLIRCLRLSLQRDIESMFS